MLPDGGTRILTSICFPVETMLLLEKVFFIN